MNQTNLYQQKLVAYLVALLLLGACGSPVAEPAPTQAAVMVMAETAVATATLPPTVTLVPSPTATATAVVITTETAVPTATTAETNTPTTTATTAATATATNPPIPTNTPRPPATPTTAAANLTIGTLPERLGEEVTVTGTVVNSASFAGGFKFTLSDGTGQVTLLMWHNVYDDCWDVPQLNQGATVRATGEVGLFEGELQVVPNFGGDVKVTAVGGPFAPARNIGDLGNHMGELVMITGQINRIESISSGAKLFVTDETGEILVFVWSNILDRVPNNVALGVSGTRVRVVGPVLEFHSNREIVPALPYDIEVLP